MKQKIKLTVKIIFIFTAFFIIFNKININELKQIKLVNPLFLLLGFVLYNISQFVSALRIHKYLEKINITPRFKDQLILYYLGMFYNTLLPGGIGGDAYKAYWFQKLFQTGYKKIIKALLIDRFSGLFAILFIIGILILFSGFKGFLTYATFLAVISPVMLYIAHRFIFKEFKTAGIKNFLYSLIIQSLQGITFVFILYSLGIDKNTVDFIVLFFISSVVSVIPLSVGGVGLRELTFLWGLEFLHINPALGVVSAFLFFIITVLSSSIGALFLKYRLGE